MLIRSCKSSVLALLAGCCIVVMSASASAITVSGGALWPSSPNVETITEPDISTYWSFSVPAGSFRPNVGQSFRVSSPLNVEEINVRFNLSAIDPSVTYKLAVYEVADTLAAGNSPTLGTNVFTSPTLNASDLSFFASSVTNVKYTLSPAEQFTLSPQTSPAGYIIQFEGVGGTLTFAQWGADHTSPSYADGRAYVYTNDGSTTDMSLALVGSVPEPSTVTLGALGLLCVGLSSCSRRLRHWRR